MNCEAEQAAGTHGCKLRPSTMHAQPPCGAPSPGGPSPRGCPPPQAGPAGSRGVWDPVLRQGKVGRGRAQSPASWVLAQQAGCPAVPPMPLVLISRPARQALSVAPSLHGTVPPAGALTSSPLPPAYARSSSDATWRCVMRAPLIFCADVERSYLPGRQGSRGGQTRGAKAAVRMPAKGLPVTYAAKTTPHHAMAARPSPTPRRAAASRHHALHRQPAPPALRPHRALRQDSTMAVTPRRVRPVAKSTPAAPASVKAGCHQLLNTPATEAPARDTCALSITFLLACWRDRVPGGVGGGEGRVWRGRSTGGWAQDNRVEEAANTGSAPTSIVPPSTPSPPARRLPAASGCPPRPAGLTPCGSLQRWGQAGPPSQ